MKQKLYSLLVGLTVIVASLLMPLSAHAAGASIYLSANRSSVSNGGTLIVAVYMNGGGNPVNTVEADLSYSTDKLQYVGLNYAGSAFEITAPSNGGGGTVNIARGTTGSVSGSGLVATVTFKALSSSGSAVISLLGSSALASDGNAIAAATSGTSVTLSTAVAATPTISSSTSASPTVAPVVAAPPKDTTPPVISAIKVTNLSSYGATITWTTNEPASSAVNYGLDTTYGISSSAANLTTTHSVALSSSFLAPLSLLHFDIESSDASGNVATSPDQTLQLPGVAVTIQVIGPDGEPQVGAVVTLDDQTATTGPDGSVTIPSSLGNKRVTTTYDGVTAQKTITVSKTTKPLTAYQLDLSKKPLDTWMLTSFGLLFVVLVLLGIDALLFGSHFFMRLSGLHKLVPKPATVSTAATPSVAQKPATVASDPQSTEASAANESPAQPEDRSASDSPQQTPSVAAEIPIDVSKTVAELMGEAVPAAVPNGAAAIPTEAAPSVTKIHIVHHQDQQSLAKPKAKSTIKKHRRVKIQ